MTTVLLVIHLLIAIALVISVLLQPSEGGGLGIGGGGGGGGGLGGFLSGRGTANLLTRTTAVLAATFMATSIALTIFAGGGAERSILDEIPEQTAPTAPGTEAPADDTGPAANGGAGEGGQQPEVPVQ